MIGIGLISCEKSNHPTDVTIAYKPTPYPLHIPKGFPLHNINPLNPLTKEGVALGKKLYQESMLSSNGRSCASCHLQHNSFSLPIHIGANGYRISVPPHVNLAFKRHFNWTGSELVLDTLCMADFGPEFFNTDSAQLFRNLLNSSFYPQAFYNAFLLQNITTLSFKELQRYIAFAISQYMRTLISAGSKYDKVAVGEATFSAEEYLGMQVFFSEKGDCFHCHQAPLFNDAEFHNNGLNSSFNGFDLGRWLVTGQANDVGKFSTPTLRNLIYTAPYMHDGRFKTLAEVIEFYNSGIHYSATIDPILNKKAPTYQLQLTTEEKSGLVAFLKTLSDPDFVNQP